MTTSNSDKQKSNNQENTPSTILPKTSLKLPMPVMNDFRGAKIRGNVAGRDYTSNVNYNYGDTTLNETVKSIETLIKDLSQDSSVNTTSEQMLIATKAIATIENNPDWKQKAIKAGKQGLLEVLKSNPLGAFVAIAIEGWQS